MHNKEERRPVFDISNTRRSSLHKNYRVQQHYCIPLYDFISAVERSGKDKHEHTAAQPVHYDDIGMLPRLFLFRATKKLK